MKNIIIDKANGEFVAEAITDRGMTVEELLKLCGAEIAPEEGEADFVLDGAEIWVEDLECIVANDEARYIIIDQIGGDEFAEIRDDANDAIREAKSSWKALSDFDKNRRNAYFVAVGKVDDNGCYDDYDIILTIK